MELPEVRGKYRFYAKLSKMCWFATGGLTKVVFMPFDQDDLQHFLKHFDTINNRIFVLGVGSNILIRDGGFDGVIIRLGNNFNGIKKLECPCLEVGAGVLDRNVALFAKDHSIGGMEFLSGIPGTIGGAVAMNAGAYGSDIASIMTSVDAMSYDGMIKKITNAEMGYEYRGNSLREKVIFLKARFSGYSSQKDKIAEKITEIMNARNSTQPVQGFKTGGSTFKNPDGVRAWELIDKAGCRGLRIGGAQMSELHCNFLINDGTATSQNIENLIIEVQKRVFETTGYRLKTEIIILGEK